MRRVVFLGTGRSRDSYQAKMSLGTLLNNADCGPSNPLQQLSKRLDTDRGVQQVTDSSGLSQEHSCRYIWIDCLTYRRLGLLWSEPSRAIPSGTVLIVASVLQPIQPPTYTGIPPVSGCRPISSVGSRPVLRAGCSTPSLRPQRALSGVTAAENTSFRESALQKRTVEPAGTGGSAS